MKNINPDPVLSSHVSITKYLVQICIGSEMHGTILYNKWYLLALFSDDSIRSWKGIIPEWEHFNIDTKKWDVVIVFNNADFNNTKDISYRYNFYTRKNFCKK